MASLTLLGVGRLPRHGHGPAGLLVEHDGDRVMIDGGPGASPRGPIDAWLVTDAHAELLTEIRALAFPYRLEPEVADFAREDGLYINPHPVQHAAHPTFGYLIDMQGFAVAWAPAYFEFPDWADGVDLMFADAAAWDRPASFVGGEYGHAAALTTARQAQARAVKRLVFVNIGRPTIRALDAGQRPSFGELGHDNQVFAVPPRDPATHVLWRPRGRGRPTPLR